MTDVVAETSPVLAEHTRLPRLRSLVTGGVATVALVVLVALVLPNAGTSAPGRAPGIQVPELSAVAPRSEVLKFLNHEAAKQQAPKVEAIPSSVSGSTHVTASAASDGQAPTITKTESHVVSNVQAAPANANSHTQMQTNDVAVTSSGKHVSSNHSVNVSSNGSQSLTSGSATNPLDVSNSFDLPPTQELFPSVP